MLALAACDPYRIAGGRVATDYAGSVTADAPRAALVGRDVLADGGNAVDAAVAAALAQGVTSPGRGGLGGGGLCLVQGSAGPDTDKKRVQALRFPAVKATDRVALPGTPRGLYALHARYGALRWRAVVAPAERLARFGTGASRALVRTLKAAGGRLRGETARGTFLADGGPPEVGMSLRRLSLAGTLSRLRREGAVDLYSGEAADRFLADARDVAEAPVPAAALRDVLPEWTAPATAGAGDHVVAAPPAGALADAWRKLPAGTAPGDDALHAATGDLTGGGPPAAGVAALDGRGNAVACAFTLNRPFGTGRLGRESGLFVAAPPADAAKPLAGLAPVLVVNRPTHSVLLAATASTGWRDTLPVARAAAVDAAARLLAGRGDVKAVLNRPRGGYAVGPGSGRAAVEADVPPARRDALRAAGLTLVERPHLGRVNAIFCRGGSPNNTGTCRAAADPRWSSLAATSAR